MLYMSYPESNTNMTDPPLFSDRCVPVAAVERDLRDASAVCRQLGIPLHEADFVSAYWNTVCVWVGGWVGVLWGMLGGG